MKNTKLIKRSQLSGLANSASARHHATHVLIDQACQSVYQTTRPSIDNVFLAGGGKFSRSSVEKRSRHRGVLDAWQRRWDDANPQERKRKLGTEQPNSRVGEGRRDTAVQCRQSAFAHSEKPVLERELKRLLRKLEKVENQLSAALECIEKQDQRHAVDCEEKSQLKLELQRARSKPHPRLPKVFSNSIDGPSRH